MKKIKLTKGKFAIVDDVDFEFLNQWRWQLDVGGYAIRRVRHGNQKREIVWMHRVINETPKGFDTDHKNRNRLDNRRINLRTVTRRQNLQNMSLKSTNSSGFKGISWHRQHKKWRSYLSIGRKYIHLGNFKTLLEAKQARKRAELIHYIQHV